jgi:hypothetical protein
MTKLIPSIFRKIREAQAPGLFRLIRPRDLSAEFYLLHWVGRNAKPNRPHLVSRTRDMETKPSFGSI